MTIPTEQSLAEILALARVSPSKIEKIIAEFNARDFIVASMASLANESNLLFALRTVMGDGTHGQKETWDERCRIGRDAIDKATSA